MDASTRGLNIYWLLGLFCCLLLQTAPTTAQNKRASRITSSRSFGTNVKSGSSNGLSFDCPEEFGYYPHPTDCTQYYVCVFGGALLESCTGGLMYSHELQTCDWPRNVGCELVDSGASASTTSTDLGTGSGSTRTKVQQQQIQHQQHVPSRVRFGAAFTSPAATQKPATVPPQYHRSPPQVIQAQVHNIPPPPELRVPPNPVVTSRGQPKPLLDSQEDIAKLYAEAHETLPPVEEEESDRQQRVYRGQPSTVSQVQRDRDGIIHQASINAIPNHGKIGSYAFGTAYSDSLDYDVTHELSHNQLDDEANKLRRRRRDLADPTTEIPSDTANTLAAATATTESLSTVSKSVSNDVTESDSSTASNSAAADTSRSLEEQYDEHETTTKSSAESTTSMQKYSSKIRQPREGDFDFDYEDIKAEAEYIQMDDEDSDEAASADTATGESKRRPRQLRLISHGRAKWPANNYRAIDQPYVHSGASYNIGSYNPYLTPPSQQTHNHNYNQLSPGYYQQPSGYQAPPQPSSYHHQSKPKVVYTGYNLALPPPAVEDDFRPIAGNYYGAAAGSSSPRPPPAAANYQQQGGIPSDLLPYLIQQLKELKERRKQIPTENFAYFHLDNQAQPPSTSTSTPAPPFDYYISGKPTTHAPHYSQQAHYSTMGGFYNNKPDQTPYTPNYSNKLVSQYSIGTGTGAAAGESTTESNYFQYNIIANQKMKGVYSTAKPNQLEHAPAFKVRPPVTPLEVTPNINVVSAPNLAYNKPVTLQQVPYKDFSQLPLGIRYATSNTSMPESYQTFTKSISTTTARPKLTNFQFNITEFMANLRASDLSKFNPAAAAMIKYFKQVATDGTSNVRNALVLRRPLLPSSTTSTSSQRPSTFFTTTTTSTTTTTPPPTIMAPRVRQRVKPTQLPRTTITTTTTARTTTTRVLKGYESFIKSIQNQIHKQSSTTNAGAGHSSPASTTSTPRPRIVNSSTLKNVEYYDENYDEEDEEEEDVDILPPSRMPPYMPMSETMAPPRPQLSAPTPPSHVVSGKTRPPVNFQTGFFEATTTRRPFPNFSQFQQQQQQGVPSFINFPSDIFQELKQRLPRPSTSTTASTTTTTATPTTPAPTRMRYTVRPQRTRGQQKWQAAQGGGDRDLEAAAKNETNFGSGGFVKGNVGGLQLNSIHVNPNAERPRVESSSPSSSSLAPTPANIFVQPTAQGPARPGKVIVEHLPSNRNYYNASTFNHGGGYPPQLLQQQSQPQQPTPFQQTQQQYQNQNQNQHQNQQQEQSSQAQAVPSSYDTSYYSVYDDDIDLYRDIEYQQQQQQQPQQQTQQPVQQYQQAVRQQPQQSTYRPLDLQLTTPTPASVPQQQHQQQQPPQREVFRYNTDYDEDLIAQIEQENAYEQQTRSPQRPEQVTIRTLDAHATPSSTARPALDARDYYNTLTTTTSAPLKTLDSVDYTYTTSAEYVESSAADYYFGDAKVTRFTTPKQPETDDYNLIAKDLAHSTASVTTKNYLGTTPTRSLSTKAGPVGSKSTSKGTTASTTRVTRPTITTIKAASITSPTSTTTTTTTTSTTTTAKPTSSKTHANKIYKQQAINKLKTTTTATTKTTTTTTTQSPQPLRTAPALQKSSSTTTSTPTTPSPPQLILPSHLSVYNSNPFLKSKLQTLAKSLVNVVAQSQTKTTSYSQAQPPLHQSQLRTHAQTNSPSSSSTSTTSTTSPTQWPLASDAGVGSSQQQIDTVETVYDESQNVQVHTVEAPSSRSFETSTSNKFLDFINAAAYGSSPRGNLVHIPPTEKPTKSSGNKSKYNSQSYEDDEFDSSLLSSTEQQQQRKRIQSFVLSDVAPRSFTTPLITPPVELVASSSSSTTRPTKAYQYSLQSGAHGFSLRAEEESRQDENISEPLYERSESPQVTPTTTPLTTTRRPITTSSTTSTTTVVTPAPLLENDADYVEILPTTYAPPLRTWRHGRPTIQQSPYKSSNAATATAATSEAAITTKAVLSAMSTERSPGAQTFTARANVFKDNLNRVTANPAMRFVSPYKSLENLLQEERLTHNVLRTTARPRFGSAPAAPPFLQTTAKPIKSYFLITTPSRNTSQTVLATMATSNARNFSVSDAILSTFSPQRPAPSMLRSTTTTSSTTTELPTTTTATSEAAPSVSVVLSTSPLRISQAQQRPRGRSRYTAATVNNLLDSFDEPTTYAPKFRFATNSYEQPASPTPNPNTSSNPRRKVQRIRITGGQGQRQLFDGPTPKPREKYETYKAAQQARESSTTSTVPLKSLKRKPIENEASAPNAPRAEALIAHDPLDTRQDNSIELSVSTEAVSSSSTEHVVAITDRPPLKYLYSNKYRQQTSEHKLAESLQNAGYITTGSGRSHKFRASNLLEQLQQFLSGSDSDESGSPQFVDDFSVPEIKAAVEEIKQLYEPANSKVSGTSTTTTATTTTTLRPTTTPMPPTRPAHVVPYKSPASFPSQPKPFSTSFVSSTNPSTSSSTTLPTTTSTPHVSTAKTTAMLATQPSAFALPSGRASRVNNAIKSSIAASSAGSTGNFAANSGSSYSTYKPAAQAVRASKFQNGFAPSNSNNHQQQQSNNNNSHNNAAATSNAAAVKCSDSTLSAKCNEIPSRNNNRNRGSAIYANQDRDVAPAPNRGTHPPRTRPTLKPSGTIVSKAQEFVDIYRYPPTRPEPLYPQPTPDKTAAKCRKDVCLLPDCYCGGKDIPGELPAESIPQIVLLTFDDSVNDLNKQLYSDLFEKGRVNPNGCPITATFYVSHEWTDYSQVQNLYADGHEMASHTVSHSFGEQFSQKKWTREVAGQREILAAYGGVKLSDVRGMRAPFLSVGGNKMYKMLYDSNFTYDSSMPVYENRPPSWPYTLDYKIFHDCMIPPCPTRSYPGVWQVPMVMWQDLNGGRCSMGDACSNPSDAEGVTKMIMKNFERHYTTNRAPFGLFYHAAWFTQPHHKEGFIKFLDAINAMPDVWIITNWQALQWVRDPTPTSRINSFQPFQCDYSDRPKRCNNPKVCNLWHKSGVRYMKTCQPCPDIYPWTGKTGIRSSRIDNEIEEPAA